MNGKFMCTRFGLFHFLACGLIIVFIPTFTAAQAFDRCLCLEKIAEDLRLPVSLVSANDGLNRMFVAEQFGQVHIFYPNGTKLPGPFVDISSRIGKLPKVSEEGFADIAFHPNFRLNGLFYMLFSTPGNDDVDNYSNLAEFKVSTTDINKADPDYFRLLFQIAQPNWPHNAEKLLFGIDNYLYIFTGDGGRQRDPNGFTQNMKTHLGKVLRIDVDSRTGDFPYGIPGDNPFLDPLPDGSFARPEIYAFGFRNPWRCGMDAGHRETEEGRGRIICGDVGQNSVEELNLIEKGGNFGWNIKEGTEIHCSKCQLAPVGKLVDPIFSYDRDQQIGKAAIGGQFYRGCLYPELDGVFLWGDYYSGILFQIVQNNATGGWENKELEMCGPAVCKHTLQSSYASKIVSFGLDENGEIYLLSVTNTDPAKKSGYIYRFVDPLVQEDQETCEREFAQKAKALRQSKVQPSLIQSSDPETSNIESTNQVEREDSDPTTTTSNPTTTTTPITSTASTSSIPSSNTTSSTPILSTTGPSTTSTTPTTTTAPAFKITSSTTTSTTTTTSTPAPTTTNPTTIDSTTPISTITSTSTTPTSTFASTSTMPAIAPTTAYAGLPTITLTSATTSTETPTPANVPTSNITPNVTIAPILITMPTSTAQPVSESTLGGIFFDDANLNTTSSTPTTHTTTTKPTPINMAASSYTTTPKTTSSTFSTTQTTTSLPIQTTPPIPSGTGTVSQLQIIVAPTTTATSTSTSMSSTIITSHVNEETTFAQGETETSETESASELLSSTTILDTGRSIKTSAASGPITTTTAEGTTENASLNTVNSENPTFLSENQKYYKFLLQLVRAARIQAGAIFHIPSTDNDSVGNNVSIAQTSGSSQATESSTLSETLSSGSVTASTSPILSSTISQAAEIQSVITSVPINQFNNLSSSQPVNEQVFTVTTTSASTTHVSSLLNTASTGPPQSSQTWHGISATTAAPEETTSFSDVLIEATIEATSTETSTAALPSNANLTVASGTEATLINDATTAVTSELPNATTNTTSAESITMITETSTSSASVSNSNTGNNIVPAAVVLPETGETNTGQVNSGPPSGPTMVKLFPFGSIKIPLNSIGNNADIDSSDEEEPDDD